MNNKRFQRLMDSVDPELLEEAKEPPRRSRKHFGSLAAMAACFVLLVGGVMIFRFEEPAQDPQQGAAQLANPIQTVTAAEVAQLGYRIPLPAEAQDTKYQLITLSQDTTPMAQVSFLVNDRDYTCRAVKTEQAEDISGIYQEWAESIDWAIGELQMQMRKAADSAWVGWFSATDGVQCNRSGTRGFLQLCRGSTQLHRKIINHTYNCSTTYIASSRPFMWYYFSLFSVARSAASRALYSFIFFCHALRLACACAALRAS